MTPKKLDLTKLTIEHFTKLPDPNCEEWKTYKSTKSKMKGKKDANQTRK